MQRREVAGDDGKYHPPVERHGHVFTWQQCFAQVEKGFRVYRFGKVGDREAWHFRIFFRRADWLNGVWRAYDMTRADSLELMVTVEAIRLPLCFEAEWENSLHDNNCLLVPRRGASLDIRWDSFGNPLVEPLRPLLARLHKIREIGRAHV